jgi:transcriptional antiterminator
MKEPVLTKKDIAKRLGVSTRTVQRLNLPHTKVGSQNRYVWSEVAAHLGIDAEVPEPRPQVSELVIAVQRFEQRLELIQRELSDVRLELIEFIKRSTKEDDG